MKRLIDYSISRYSRNRLLKLRRNLESQVVGERAAHEDPVIRQMFGCVSKCVVCKRNLNALYYVRRLLRQKYRDEYARRTLTFWR